MFLQASNPALTVDTEALPLTSVEQRCSPWLCILYKLHHCWTQFPIEIVLYELQTNSHVLLNTSKYFLLASTHTYRGFLSFKYDSS